MEESEIALLDAFRHGSRDALADVYDRHGDRLYTFALERLGDPDEATEVVAQTFAQAELRGVGLPDGTALGPWLFGIARELLSDRVRQRERLVSLGARVDATPLVPESTPDEQAFDLALNELRDVDRDLLELHLWGWFDTDDLASMFGVQSDHLGVMVGRIERRVELGVGSLPIVDAADAECDVLAQELLASEARSPQARRALVRGHLEECDACRVAHRALVDWHAIAAGREVAPAPEFLRSMVVGSPHAAPTPVADPANTAPVAPDGPPPPPVPPEAEGPAPGRSRRRPLLLVAAASIAAVATFGVVWATGDERPERAESPPTSTTAPATTTTQAATSSSTPPTTASTIPPATAPPTTVPSTTVPSTTVPSTTTIDPALALLEQLPDFEIDVP